MLFLAQRVFLPWYVGWWNFQVACFGKQTNSIGAWQPMCRHQYYYRMTPTITKVLLRQHLLGTGCRSGPVWTAANPAASGPYLFFMLRYYYFVNLHTCKNTAERSVQHADDVRIDYWLGSFYLQGNSFTLKGNLLRLDTCWMGKPSSDFEHVFTSTDCTAQSHCEPWRKSFPKRKLLVKSNCSWLDISL